MIVGDSEQLSSQEEEELRAHIRLGAGLIAPVKVINLQSSGNSKSDLTMKFGDTSFVTLESLDVKGRIDKIKNHKSEVHGSVRDGNEIHASILVDEVGKGQTVRMAFDLGKTAEKGNSADVTRFITEAVKFVAPGERALLPGGASTKKLTVSALVTDLDVEISVDLGTELILLDAGRGEVSRAGRIVTFRPQVNMNEPFTATIQVQVPSTVSDTYMLDVGAMYLIHGMYFEDAREIVKVVVNRSAGEILENVIARLIAFEEKLSGPERNKIKSQRLKIEGLKNSNSDKANRAKNSIELLLESLQAVEVAAPSGTQDGLLEVLAEGVTTYGSILMER